MSSEVLIFDSRCGHHEGPTYWSSVASLVPNEGPNATFSRIFYSFFVFLMNNTRTEPEFSLSPSKLLTLPHTCTIATWRSNTKMIGRFSHCVAAKCGNNTPLLSYNKSYLSKREQNGTLEELDQGWNNLEPTRQCTLFCTTVLSTRGVPYMHTHHTARECDKQSMTIHRLCSAKTTWRAQNTATRYSARAWIMWITLCITTLNYKA